MNEKMTELETVPAVDANETAEPKAWTKPGFEAWNIDITQTSPSVASDATEAGLS